VAATSPTTSSLAVAAAVVKLKTVAYHFLFFSIIILVLIVTIRKDFAPHSALYISRFVAAASSYPSDNVVVSAIRRELNQFILRTAIKF
jgi:hypothetical protein